LDLNREIETHISVIQKTFNAAFLKEIEKQGEIISRKIFKGGKVLFMGNGGSAADSQHISAEFVCKLSKIRQPLPAMTLTVDTSALTAIANDYGYEHIFSRQISALCTAKDVVIGISTSGASQNVVKGFAAANQIGAYTIGFSGIEGFVGANLDFDFKVLHNVTARIQEAHILLGHLLCRVAEKAFV